MRLQTCGHHLGNAFDSGVLEGDGSEVLRPPSVFFLGQKNQVGSVDPFYISAMVMEGREQAAERGSHCCPARFEKMRAETIGTGTGSGVHVSDGVVDLVNGEAVIKMVEGEATLGGRDRRGRSSRSWQQWSQED